MDKIKPLKPFSLQVAVKAESISAPPIVHFLYQGYFIFYSCLFYACSALCLLLFFFLLWSSVRILLACFMYFILRDIFNCCVIFSPATLLVKITSEKVKLRSADVLFFSSIFTLECWYVLHLEKKCCLVSIPPNLSQKCT